MTDVNFSYGFVKYPLRSGREIQRPVFPVTLTNDRQSIETLALLDSGADLSMIPRGVAEGLGIDVDACPEDDSNSVSGTFRIALHDLHVTLRQRLLQDTFAAQFQIPKSAPGYPPIVLLGREPLFRRYDVSFRMGYTEDLGKFVLHKQTKSRDSDRFKVGGKPLRDSKIRVPR